MAIDVDHLMMGLASLSAQSLDGIITLDVDGVTTYFAEMPGPTMAGIRFRVGHADESLPIRGVTHLVEHLALHAIGEVHASFNGCVSATDTQFIVRGAPEMVGKYLADVTRALRTLPVDRLAAEKQVLATESAGKSPSAHGSLLSWRYGCEGYGLASTSEFGRYTLDAGAVQAWSDRWFTSANASMWISGAWPENLSLTLPEGTWMPPPTPAPMPQRRPGWFTDRAGVVAFDAQLPRSEASSMAMSVLLNRLEARIRRRDAATYNVSGDLEQWSADAVHVYVAADALPEHASTVLDGMLACLAELAIEGPTTDELAQVVRRARESWDDPYGAARLADVRSLDRIQRRQPRSVASVLESLMRVSPRDVQLAVEQMRRDLLVLVPPSASIKDGRFDYWDGWSVTPTVGTPIDRVVVPDDASARHRLVVGEEGITFVQDEGKVVALRFDQVAAVQHWDDGARTVIGRDGSHVFVHPAEWNHGDWATQMVDWAIRDGRVVPMGCPAGSRYLDEVKRRGPWLPARTK